MYSRELASARQVEPVNQALGTLFFQECTTRELARYLARSVPQGSLPATLQGEKINQALNTLSRASLGIELVLEHHVRPTIYNWFAQFKHSRVNLIDEFRDGRPPTAVNNKYIDAVRTMILTEGEPMMLNRDLLELHRDLLGCEA
ncbi:hypothetical protein EVAR_42388_1 [Eumeta japonica]|uniref:Mos1 transposase HTH domain-containing protein n=1 Tax=Eumeta variegata TaxID=151549 RepID=A0A4C1YLD6_EUMVA|nr:hypothetical protein EVAR_42388_1 [Eumeta japonica]